MTNVKSAYLEMSEGVAEVSGDWREGVMSLLFSSVEIGGYGREIEIKQLTNRAVKCLEKWFQNLNW